MTEGVDEPPTCPVCDKSPFSTVCLGCGHRPGAEEKRVLGVWKRKGFVQIYCAGCEGPAQVTIVDPDAFAPCRGCGNNLLPAIQSDPSMAGVLVEARAKLARRSRKAPGSPKVERGEPEGESGPPEPPKAFGALLRELPLEKLLKARPKPVRAALLRLVAKRLKWAPRYPAAMVLALAVEGKAPPEDELNRWATRMESLGAAEALALRLPPLTGARFAKIAHDVLDLVVTGSPNPDEERSTQFGDLARMVRDELAGKQAAWTLFPAHGAVPLPRGDMPDPRPGPGPDPEDDDIPF